MRNMFPQSPASILFFVAVLAPSAALAQTLADPTRPAAAWLAAQDPRAAAKAQEEAATPGVQITVIGPARKFAIVNGHAVRPGETYNGSKLVAVDESGVVWQHEGGQERTSMSPSVEKSEPGGRPLSAAAKHPKKSITGGTQ